MYDIEVISVSHGPYRHYGIPYPDGRVLSASKHRKSVVFESQEEFSKGKAIKSEWRKSEFSPEDVYSRGAANIGVPYSLFSSNCDHLITEILGERRKSPQLRAAVGLTAVVGILWLFGRRTA